MTLPANIRVNTLLPFPAQVTGIAPVVLGKNNGIWTVQLNFGLLAPQTPTALQQMTDYTIVWDSVAKDYFLFPLSSMTGSVPAPPLQRSVTTTPVTIAANDRILNLNLSAPASITLPGYVARNGLPLRFVDAGLQTTTNNVTINTAASEFIDGSLTSVVLNTNGQVIELTPYNDGVNAGWKRS